MKFYLKTAAIVILATTIIAVITTVNGLPIDTSNGWIGYWGSIVGGCMTLIGVKITIDENKKEGEELRNRTVQPAFTRCKTRLTLDDIKHNNDDSCVYCVFDTPKGTVDCGNPFVNHINGQLKDETPGLKDFESNYLAYKYKITNIGCGSAFKVSVDVQSMTLRECMGIAVKDSHEFIILMESQQGNEMHIKIRIEFENVYGKKYYQEETLHYQKKDDCIVNIRTEEHPKGLSEVDEIEKKGNKKKKTFVSI